MADLLDDEARVRAALTRCSDAAAGATDVGRVRRRNEDAYWVDRRERFALVADGLGGLPDGHIASRVAVVAAAQLLESRFDARSSAPAVPSRPQTVARQLGTDLGDAFAAAQERVLAQPRPAAAELTMATTLIGAAIQDHVAVIAHVGDVRGYVWRQGRAAFVTVDHSRLGTLVREGVLTREAVRHRPDRNIVTEVLGIPEGYNVDVDTVGLEDGDVVVLCSDGLWEAVDEEGMARLLAHAGSAAEAATWLIHAANSAGGRDNITVVVMRHAGNGSAAA
ncbi:MAG TPA: protein phosphatase 2C domain-containing protein [Candidatus Limnocylindrales bacterium]|nr:protein phosphatase 2C domain-containing protein [Candidatus Limnocylindrales bacterium]